MGVVLRPLACVNLFLRAYHRLRSVVSRPWRRAYSMFGDRIYRGRMSRRDFLWLMSATTASAAFLDRP